ncbi:MAG: tetratricopeptide repeat protein [Candidatus Omnitrophota bacterium]
MNNFCSTILKSNLKVFLLLALLVLSAYSPMLHSPFKNIDDEFSIVRNTEIRDLANIPKFFQSTYFKMEKDYYRPLVPVTYALEYRFFKLDWFFYNLDNVLIHLGSAFLVFLICGFLFDHRARAFAVSGLFAIHPIHWEAVGNVSGRAILLCAFFVLAAFYFFLRYCRDARLRDVLLSALCYALALSAKESAGMFIAVAASYWLIVARKGWRSLLQLWPFALVAGGYVVHHRLMHITPPYPWPNASMMALGVITFLRGVGTYLRLMVMPVHLYFDRARPIYGSFTDPWLWVTLGIYLGLILALLRNLLRMPALALFCIIWFWLELFPISQVVTSIGAYPMAISLAEHFMYLACIPALILIVAGAAWLVRREAISGAAMKVAGGGFAIFLYLMLVQQNIYAGNESLVLMNSLKNDPRNARVEYALAKIYVKTGRFDQALDHFKKAVALNDGNLFYQVAYGKALADNGEYLKAVRVYEKVPPFVSTDQMLKENKAAAYTALAKQYEEKLRAAPKDADLLFALGVFYGRLERNREAYDSFAAAWAVDSTRLDALFNMGVMADLLGDKEKAEAAFRKEAEARAKK